MRGRIARLTLLVGFAVIIGRATPAKAFNDYDELIDGDLSGDRFNPTDISLSLGSNLLHATSVAGDLEYFTMHLPAGGQLDSIVLTTYVSGSPMSFIAVQSGTTFTEPPAGTNPANLLGWTHFGGPDAPAGTDILDNLGLGAGSIGFTPPLAGGPYTFWSQETGPNTATYTMNFVVTPEPAAIMLLGLGASIALLRRRKR